MKTCEAIVEAAAKKAGWVEYLIPLIPVFAEMLAQLLEECTNTEDQAVAMLCSPSPLQALIMHSRVTAALRRDSKVPIRERRAAAWQVINDVVASANDDPEKVCEAFVEATVKPQVA